jgi:hypothetical protein
VIECEISGATPPETLPRVVWRAGLDLHPLNVADPDDLAWLDALIWPEHTHRRERLRAAAHIAGAEKAILRRGDLVDDLAALANQRPDGATLVIFHTSVLYQVPAERRAAFADQVRDLPAHWISVEHPGLVDYDRELPASPDGTLHNVLALDGRPLAWSRPHGQGLAWFAM